MLHFICETAIPEMNNVDSQARLAESLHRINDQNIRKLDRLLLRNCKIDRTTLAA